MNLKGFSLGFVVGGLVGGLGTYLYFKKKNELDLETEIQEVKDYYKNKYSEKNEPKNKESEPPKKEESSSNEDKKMYKKIIDESEYLDEKKKGIEVINEYDFASDCEFEKIGILMFIDGIFTYDDGSKVPIENIKNILGNDYKNNLPVDDTPTYFRDYTLKVDYEILYDERRYKDIV